MPASARKVRRLMRWVIGAFFLAACGVAFTPTARRRDVGANTRPQAAVGCGSTDRHKIVVVEQQMHEVLARPQRRVGGSLQAAALPLQQPGLLGEEVHTRLLLRGGG